MSISTESHFPEVVEKFVFETLQRRKDILIIACSQRSKFEQWLKFELASMLTQEYGIDNVLIEPLYPSGDKADISVIRQNQTWYLELKTINTNWRADGANNKTRPITDNIDGIVEDINKIRRIFDQSSGLVAFVLFPVPMRIWCKEQEKIFRHLRRVECEGSLLAESLVNKAKIVEITPAFGVMPFVVEISK